MHGTKRGPGCGWETVPLLGPGSPSAAWRGPLLMNCCHSLHVTEKWMEIINAINGSSAEVLTRFYSPSNMSCWIQATFSFPLNLWLVLGTLWWGCAIIQGGRDLWRSLELNLSSKHGELQSLVRLPGAHSSTLTLQCPVLRLFHFVSISPAPGGPKLKIFHMRPCKCQLMRLTLPWWSWLHVC